MEFSAHADSPEEGFAKFQFPVYNFLVFFILKQMQQARWESKTFTTQHLSDKFRKSYFSAMTIISKALQNLPFIDYQVDVQMQYAEAARIIRGAATSFFSGTEHNFFRDFPAVFEFVRSHVATRDHHHVEADRIIQICYKYWKHYTDSSRLDVQIKYEYEITWQKHIRPISFLPIPPVWYDTEDCVHHPPAQIQDYHTTLLRTPPLPPPLLPPPHDPVSSAVATAPHTALSTQPPSSSLPVAAASAPPETAPPPNAPSAYYPPIQSCCFPPRQTAIELAVPDLPRNCAVQFSYYGDAKESKVIVANVQCLSRDQIPKEAIVFMAQLMQRTDLSLIIDGACDLYLGTILDILSCGVTIDSNEKFEKFKHYSRHSGTPSGTDQMDVDIGREYVAANPNPVWVEGTMYEASLQQFVRFTRAIHDGTSANMMCYHGGLHREVDPNEDLLYMIDLDINNSCLLNSEYQLRTQLPDFSAGGDYCSTSSVSLRVTNS